MKIINEADLSYEFIGKLIDDIINNCPNDTYNIGDIEIMNFGYKGREYRLQIRYLKSYVEWRFMEK
jgi:N-acetyl-beta-hexosaminidase